MNEVNFVRKCIATDTSQYDLWGKLVCTNFKISFITDDPMPLQVGYCSYGYIMNVRSGIIHTFSVNNKWMPSKQLWMRFHCPVLNVLLFHPFISGQEQEICTEAHPAPFTSMYGGFSRKGFYKDKAGIIHRCVPPWRNSLQMSLGLDKCQISTWWSFIGVTGGGQSNHEMRIHCRWSNKKRGEFFCFVKAELMTLKTMISFWTAQHTTLEIQVVSCVLFSVEFALPFGLLKEMFLN